MLEAYTLARYIVFGAFAASALVALASWLVRTRRISPFGFPGRMLRAMSDPVLRPVETRLLRLGGNPARAGWWLAVGVAAIGVAVLAAWNWTVGVLYGVMGAFSGGPRAAGAFVIVLAYRIVVAALVVRVLASWFGYHRYTRWLRPAYALTDWVVEPLRRLLPPFGALDWSPLAAWLLLMVLERILLIGVGS
ncbi:MAG TPA: YggT family protein [Gemmatimonadales bacterium]|nr:YggT family protein [Gemmatimonadales bacterium]